ncbi:MAG: RNA polymerase factor sigma-54 [Nitrospirae bacterium]|jgi:RNA polymerase sigma-54 factor|nr:RNA polymerase factor sigma-54 [Nitrospirota bacterium]
MALENRLELKLSQKLILTPQLQQAIKLLQLPHLELSEFLSQELLENPFLEESLEETSIEELSNEERDTIEYENETEDLDAPLEKLLNFTSEDYFEERSSDGRDMGYFNPGTVTTPSFEQFISKKPDLSEHLIWQLRLSNAPENIKRVAEIIIGDIDENGYLTSTLEEIQNSAETDIETTMKALKLVQGFDPPGVAARNIQECLLLQLKNLNLTETVVEKIILQNMEELEKKKYSVIAQQHGVTVEDVMAAVKIIEGLEPKPGRTFSDVSTNYITPDVFIIKTEDGYQIILNDEGIPKLRISNYYRQLIMQENDLPKEERQFLLDRMRSATGLLKSLDQRNRTIYRVTEILLELQKDFFEKGSDYMKPLTLRDVAANLNLHESTVSRVTSNKYLSCPHGVFPFRFLFSSALHSGTGSVSSTSVKNSIKKFISDENPKKPHSDQEISEMLKKSGIVIARRTVAKYREELGIPPQSQRRKKNN